MCQKELDSGFFRRPADCPCRVTNLRHGTNFRHGLPRRHTLAVTGYCHFQYCTIYIAIQGGWGDTIFFAIERAIQAGSGMPKLRDVCEEYDWFVHKNL